MQKIGSITDTADSAGEFTDGNVAGGVSPTILDAAWFNTIQRELVNIVQSGGLALDPTNDTQVLSALENLFLENSLFPVGAPQPWPTATAPTGWLKCNGASFSTTTYPNLAIAYPGGVLPDLRGEFIRGFDDGRGLDSGRVLMSAQAHSIQQHNHYMYTQGTTAGSIWAPLDNTNNSQTIGDSAIGNGTSEGQWFSQTSGPSGNFTTETRPVNIAFNYIVRAA
jgi:microcystin-dependent protein